MIRRKKKISSLHARMICANLVEIGPLVLQQIFNFVNVILLFCYHLPMEKGVTLNFINKKTDTLYPRMSCAKIG